MTINERIKAFTALGEYMRVQNDELIKIMEEAGRYNPWYMYSQVKNAVLAIGNLLYNDNLENWLQPYYETFKFPSNNSVGLILAGNIPLVGFHDMLVCLIAGFNIQVKPAADDRILPTHILNILQNIEPAFREKIQIVERLHSYDLIIATGSNNTSRYFDYYFSHVPHIIRKNRNGVAILTGQESMNELADLGHDIFDYFGLGCRNVSKLYVPEGFNFSSFFEAIEPFSDIADHHKYFNNYEYNKAIYLVNGDKHLDNGFLLLKEDERIASPLAVVHYQTYLHLDELESLLQTHKDEIQCLLSSEYIPVTNIPTFAFGEGQKPALNDYADGINTLAFLATYV
ncbi:hypothetical protein SAMN05216436_12639 [bacterium A37T11]|nr:hypothetical protein SAMN05216436_12639 [bacterium A37T11]